MQETTESRSQPSSMKAFAVIAGVAVVFGFFAHQVYLNFFVYTDENPTRHDLGILRQAEAGYAQDQYRMGLYLITGRQGIDPDLAAARRWFELAAAQDYAPAQYKLGDLYRYGKGVEKDLQEALRLFRVAAANGNLAARNALGEVHFRGEGLEQSAESAIEHFHPAAEAGFAPAQRNMGIMAADGQGMPRDYAVAMDWYRKAAEQTDAVATVNIGLMYEHGQGVEIDLQRAWDCYYTAGLWSYSGAGRHLERIEAALPEEWLAKGLYERDLRDCLSGTPKRISVPVSRVRPKD